MARPLSLFGEFLFPPLFCYIQIGVQFPFTSWNCVWPIPCYLQFTCNHVDSLGCKLQTAFIAYSQLGLACLNCSSETLGSVIFFHIHNWKHQFPELCENSSNSTLNKQINILNGIELLLDLYDFTEMHFGPWLFKISQLSWFAVIL